MSNLKALDTCGLWLSIKIVVFLGARLLSTLTKLSSNIAQSLSLRSSFDDLFFKINHYQDF